MDYWDTSALVKLYTPEADSPYFMKLAARSGEPINSSAITVVEIVSAAWRKELAGSLQPGGARVATQRYLDDCGAGRIVAIPVVVATDARLRALAGLMKFDLLPPVALCGSVQL